MFCPIWYLFSVFGRFYVFDRFCDHLVREERADFFALRWFVTCNYITSVVVCLLFRLVSFVIVAFPGHFLYYSSSREC